MTMPTELATQPLPRSLRNRLWRGPAIAALAAMILASTFGVDPARAHEIEDGPYAGTNPSATDLWLSIWIDLADAEGGITADLLDLRSRLQALDTAPNDQLLARKLAERVLTVDRKIELYGGRDGGVARWRPLVERHFEAADIEWALHIVDCESNGDPLAENPRSSASGLFQHLASAWEARSEAAGIAGSSIWDPEANVAVAAWLFYEGGGKRHWTC